MLLRSSFGQLTGSIRSLPDPFMLSIIISNPTKNTISILNWNNVFDPVLSLPPSFSVKDEQGNLVNLASTNGMRAGMSDDDLHHLGPGDRYNRIINLRLALQGIPNGPVRTAPTTLTVSLPLGFRGISHDGSYKVSPAAAANLTSQTPKFGDFAAARLEDISVTARHLTVILPLTNNQSHATSGREGIHTDASDCQGQDAIHMAVAMNDAGVYARSLYLATSDAVSPLFPDFFSPSATQTVSAVASTVWRTITQRGPLVNAYCTDQSHICDTYPNMLGYGSTASWLGNAYLVVCPKARSLPRALVPCISKSEVQITTTISHVMFHLILTINNAVGTMNGNVYGSDGCQQLKNSAIFRPINNADSYAELAIAQWNTGLGGSPYRGASCVSTSGVVPGS
ncbi:MAG: hypothetical protein Q9220_003982 [cf. Caloplaca sp. 1 TL-2023]